MDEGAQTAHPSFLLAGVFVVLDPVPDSGPRIRSDPWFYAILATIGGTYVLLIVAMLAADALYVLTSDLRESVVLDFSNDSQGRQLQTGDDVVGRFERYGLTIFSDAPQQYVPRVLDSDKPAAAWSHFGTPHQDFGGPGLGQGGSRGGRGENSLPLGKVIVLAEPLTVTGLETVDSSRRASAAASAATTSATNTAGLETSSATGESAATSSTATSSAPQRSADGKSSPSAAHSTLMRDPIVSAERSQAERTNVVRSSSQTAIKEVRTALAAQAVGGELVVSWVEPVLVRRVSVSRLGEPGGELVAYDGAGNRLARMPVGEPTAGRWEVELSWSGVARLDLLVNDPKAEVAVAYTAESTLVAGLDRLQKQTVPLASWRTVPQQGRTWSPWTQAGTLICEWEDPVELEQLRLLDIREPGGELIARDLAGQTIWRQKLESRGVNGVQTLRVRRAEVARLELHLSRGGALAELQFAWQRRVRSAWQREHPFWARLAYNPITLALAKPEIQYSIKLTLISCTITAILSLWVAIPIGYLMSRHRFWGRNLIDATLDIPIVLPPLVVGLSLLILFQFFPALLREKVVYQIPAVILAQFSVACAFAVRTMRATFDQIDSRQEQVALTLGCSRWQAFGMVVLPEARRGILTAATLSWARSLGEFGPLLVFAGTTRNKTEVLSTTVFLELNVGNLGAAVAVSLIMVVAAVAVLVLARSWGTRNLTL